jgi:hypothetical protein
LASTLNGDRQAVDLTAIYQFQTPTLASFRNLSLVRMQTVFGGGAGYITSARILGCLVTPQRHSTKTYSLIDKVATETWSNGALCSWKPWMHHCKFYHDLEEEAASDIRLINALSVLTTISVSGSCVTSMAELQTAVAICGVGSFSTRRDFSHQLVDMSQ